MPGHLLEPSATRVARIASGHLLPARAKAGYGARDISRASAWTYGVVMKQELALRLLDKIMQWDATRPREEFAWLSLMSRLKYDGYRDFAAGLRFIENLASWLQQFEPSERETAYSFVRKNLTYIDAAQIQHLVELAFPEAIRRRLVAAVASEARIPYHRIWVHPDTSRAYLDLLRRTLFVGLSDGARMDTFRRANVGIIDNEQVVLSQTIDPDKWGGYWPTSERCGSTCCDIWVCVPDG